MYKDSSAFVAWANHCRVNRGYQDISAPSLGYASSGDSTMATGKSQANGVVSLGDGGWAVCIFPNPIKNGPGPDFAVFENGFDDSFLELAVVEVSSDGVNFMRFKAHSLTSTTLQTGSFGSTDPTKINNLAGKYRGGYGTPFDLQELAGTPGLNINAITHVKVIDVVGSVNSAYATYDGFGNMINDPWPTAFPSGGFDLDAIGVINQDFSAGITESLSNPDLSVYPNPLNRHEQLQITSTEEIQNVYLFDNYGRLVAENKSEIENKDLGTGTYFLKVITAKSVCVKKIIVL
jgi:hypothetical protein